jgi:hypothetical protein
MRVEALLFLIAAVPRVVYLFTLRPRFESPYWALSGSLIRTGTLSVDGIPITDFEPLYPIFLAGVRTIVGDSILGAQLAQVALASFGAVLMFRLTCALTGSRRPAIVAAMLFAIHPMLVRHASSASDSALTSVLVLAFVGASISERSGSIIPGLWLGLAVLSRATLMPLIPLAAIVQAWRGKIVAAVLVVGVAACALAPWILRSYLVNGSWLPTRSGINLYIGNSPYTPALFPEHDLDLLEGPAYQMASAARPDIAPDDPDYVVRINAYLTRASVAHMLQSPLSTARLKLEKVAYFLSPYLTPHYVAGPQSRVRLAPPATVIVENFVERPPFQIVVYFVFTAFVMAAAVVGVYLRRQTIRTEAMLWAVALTVVTVHTIYFPASRYRTPMSFVFLHYAAIALSAAMNWPAAMRREAGDDS